MAKTIAGLQALLLALIYTTAAWGEGDDSDNQYLLTKEQILPIGLWILSLPESPDDYEERRAVQTHTNDLGDAGAKALKCTYTNKEGRGSSYPFWYEKVGASQSTLLRISRKHILAGLGDYAFTTCPQTLKEAEEYMMAAVSKFRKLRAGMDPNDPAPAPLPQLPPNEPIYGCAYIDEDFALVNRCNFDVNFKYCGSEPMTRSHCVPHISKYLPSKKKIIFKDGSFTSSGMGGM
jgi:hypothetical protein